MDVVLIRKQQVTIADLFSSDSIASLLFAASLHDLVEFLVVDEAEFGLCHVEKIEVGFVVANLCFLFSCAQGVLLCLLLLFSDGLSFLLFLEFCAQHFFTGFDVFAFLELTIPELFYGLLLVLLWFA